MYKKLAINTGLSFLAAFAATFGAFMEATPKPVDTAVYIAAAAGAAYAGVRAAVGFLALRAKSLPAIPTDV